MVARTSVTEGAADKTPTVILMQVDCVTTKVLPMPFLARFRIATRLATLGLILLAATAITAVVGWHGLDRLHVFQQDSAAAAQAYATAADTARVVQLDFKKQVQEWKDLLLRGHNPEAFARHRGAFLDQSGMVRADLFRLRGQLIALGSKVTDVDAALRTHDDLRKKYMAALSQYGAESNDAEKMDARVKGIDRAPTAAIDGIVARVRNEFLLSSIRISNDSKATHSAANFLLIAIALCAVLAGATITVLLALSITRPITRAVAVAHAVASGDLVTHIGASGRDETAELLTALSGMNTGLHRIVGTIRESAEGILHAAGEIAEGNLDLSSRTSEQAAALEETASSMQEFSEGVHSNAAATRDARAATERSLSAAHDSEQAMRMAMEAMTRISDTSGRIAEMSSTINQIALQTHILSLNATVEAAHAGELGKGFHVVAAEVRMLAARSREAAREIHGLLEHSAETIIDGSRQLGAAGKHIFGLVGDVKTAAVAVGAIAEMTHAQASGVLQVNQAIRQIDEATQSNSARVEEAAAASDAVRQRVRGLVESVAFFRLSP